MSRYLRPLSFGKLAWLYWLAWLLLLGWYSASCGQFAGQVGTTSAAKDSSFDKDRVGDPNGTGQPSPDPSKPPVDTTALVSMLDMEQQLLQDWQLQAPAQSGSGFVQDVVARGKYAYRLQAGSNYNDAAFLILRKPLPLTPNRLYVQFLLRMEQRQNDGHTTFALVAGEGMHSEVRMGGQFGMLVANLEETDGQKISADSFNQFPNPVVLEPNKWYCMQLLFDGEAQQFRTWLDDQEIKNLNITRREDWTSPPKSNMWIPTITQLKLGWQSYGAGNGNTIYLDDIAVSQTQQRCPAITNP